MKVSNEKKIFIYFNPETGLFLFVSIHAPAKDATPDFEAGGRLSECQGRQPARISCPISAVVCVLLLLVPTGHKTPGGALLRPMFRFGE